MRFLFLITVVFISHVSFSQTDTINLKEVELKTLKISPSEIYKKVEFDSTLLSNNFAQNLGELLENNTSSYIKSNGAGMLSTLSFRGTSAQHTQVYWNGISVNSPTLGMTDLSIIPVAFITDAEVHYGASGIVDGSGSIGGSIQLSQNANWNNKVRVTLKNQQASFNGQSNNISVELGNQKIQSQTSILQQSALNNYEFIDVSKSEKHLQKLQNADYTNIGFTQNIYYKLNKKNRLNFKSYYLKNERNLPPLIGVTFANEHQTDEHFRTLLEWDNFGYKYKQSLKLAYLKDNQNYFNESISLQSQILVDKVSSFYQYNRNIFNKIELKTNVLNEWSKARSDGFASSKEQVINSLLVSLEYSKNRWFTNFVGRQELLNFKLVPFSPSLGVRYQITKQKDYFLKANLSRVYKNPTLNEKYWVGLGNPNLLPEQGWSTEVALTAKPNKTNSFAITVFNNSISNWIQWLPDSTSLFKPTNLNNVNSQGIELDASKKIQIKQIAINLQTSYSYTNISSTQSNSINDNSANKQLIYVPFHKLQGSVKLVCKSYAIAYNQNFTSKVFILKDHSMYLPYFAPATLVLSKAHQFNKSNSLNMQFKINNVFNEDYHVVANRPMPRRNYALSLVYDFNK